MVAALRTSWAKQSLTTRAVVRSRLGGKDSSGMSALEKKELLKKGELTEDMVQGDSVTDKMLLRQLKMQQMGL